MPKSVKVRKVTYLLLLKEKPDINTGGVNVHLAVMKQAGGVNPRGLLVNILYTITRREELCKELVTLTNL